MPTYETRNSPPNYVHATFKSPTGASGIFHAFGYYAASATSVALNQGSLTQAYGSANNAYGAKAFAVASGAGTASGGTSGVPTLTVSGTSYNPATGVRTATDTELLVADATAATTNKFYETTKYWIGAVTFTLATTGNRTSYAFTFNYGLGVALQFNSQDVIIQRVTATGRAGGNDTGFNIQYLKHSPTGWVYAASGFVPGGTVLWDMNVDYVTEKNLVNGVRWRWTRSNLTQAILGRSGEGIVVRITTSANNAIESSDYRIYYSVS
jgi:hypothetical protein